MIAVAASFRYPSPPFANMSVNPTAYDVRGYAHRPPPRWRWIFPVIGAVAVVVALVILVVHVRRRVKAEPKTPVAQVVVAPKPAPHVVSNAPPVFWRKLVCPTDRTNILDAPIAESFQDTGTGDPRSGMFGTLRTSESGLGQFHEGLDIKCLKRDRHGNPLDKVYAVAEGRVAYASRIGGNSNYGKYIVLLHPDRVGEIYTLYAHLSEIEPAVQPGAFVTAGETIALMGHTSSSPIPVERAHLHFEIGLVINTHFTEWYRGKRQTPDHGNWHGWNLLGVNPLDALRFAHDRGKMDFGEFLKTTPVAFTLAIRAAQLPDFFRRYSVLWQGAPFDGAAFVITVNENGTPLSGRNATHEEKLKLGKQVAAVLAANPDVIGRNGRRLVQQTKSGWKTGSNGMEWLEILLYPQRVR